MIQYQGVPKTSVFGEASFACPAALTLPEKAGFRPLFPIFPKLSPKPTGFWGKLYLYNNTPGNRKAAP
jgi:hypothetical protein